SLNGLGSAFRYIVPISHLGIN
ncbi:unnamed protein product, partial [Rotaria sp. Silwood2]